MEHLELINGTSPSSGYIRLLWTIPVYLLSLPSLHFLYFLFLLSTCLRFVCPVGLNKKYIFQNQIAFVYNGHLHHFHCIQNRIGNPFWGSTTPTAESKRHTVDPPTEINNTSHTHNYVTYSFPDRKQKKRVWKSLLCHAFWL